VAIQRFRPEIWSAALLAAYRKSLVFAGPAVVNRDYEGEIRQAGDTVHITSIGRPTIGTYSANSTTLTYEELEDASRALIVDQQKYFAFKIDDVDKAQARGDIMGPAMREAAYGLADVADQYVAGLYTGAASANALGTVAVTSADLAYTQLVSLWTKLTNANVPMQGRYVVVPPWYYALLLSNDKFINADKAGSDAGLREGMVGRALGFDVYVSNNCPNPTGDDYAVMAGTPGAITFADQIVSTEAVRLETSFGDGVRGLNVYGARLVRPDGIATVVASIT
jgi:hypothetical protein